MSVFISKEIEKYTWADFSIKNKNVASSKLIKNDNLTLGGFKAVKLVFSVSLVNGNTINVINYYLFNEDNKRYFSIEYLYTDSEILTLPSFNAFINSIKKIK
jgi:hypothetical protein